MLDVYITFDTEIWCDGWNNLDDKFNDYFQRYVYGHTSKGEYALPINLKILEDNGLKATFFVEPLFSERFGIAPLSELVGVIQQAKQDVQLHIHTEWLDEAHNRLLPDIDVKTQYLFQFELDHQERILQHGLELLSKAGVTSISAFRAGSFAANLDTLSALSRVGITIDSSYNPAMTHLIDHISDGDKAFFQPKIVNDVCVYPVSAINDVLGLRHLQVTACSFSEFKFALDKAEAENWDSLVLVSHNFELLDHSKTKADVLLRKRFQKLCEYLGEHKDRFNVKLLSEAKQKTFSSDVIPFQSNLIRTGSRYLEQLSRRLLLT